MRNLLACFILLSSITLFSCDDGSVNTPPTSNLEKDILYFSTGDSLHYDSPSVLWTDNGVDIQTDLGSAPYSTIISKEISNDGLSLSLKVKLGNDTANLVYKKSTFKRSEMPGHNEQHPFDGVGIVGKEKIAFQYKDSENKIKIFNLVTGETIELAAIRNNEQVDIENSIILKGNGITPPYQTNVHKWVTSQGLESTAYMILWTQIKK